MSCDTYTKDADELLVEAMSSPNAQGGYEHADQVDHPSHYRTAAGIETIDVIEAFELDFHCGNAVKYILRAGRKDGELESQDVEKAIWYLRRYLEKVCR